MKQNEFNLKFVGLISKREKNEGLSSLLKDGKKINRLRALEVYQEDYEARLTECLKSTYAAVTSFLGDDKFNHVALLYIGQYPSCSPDLEDYGEHFADFLTTLQVNQDFPFLFELAHFEWNFRTIFHKAEKPGLTSHEILENPEAEVILSSAATFLEYHFQINRLYALKDSDGEEIFEYEIPETLLMYKKDVMVKIFSLSKGQCELLKKFQTPVSIAEALQNAPANVAPEEIQHLFSFLGTERLLLKSKTSL